MPIAIRMIPTIPAGFNVSNRERSERAPSRDQIDDQDDDGDDEQQMDEAAHRVGADEPEQPKHQQDNEDSPKHRVC